jgi:hypothetical protein
VDLLFFIKMNIRILLRWWQFFDDPSSTTLTKKIKLTDKENIRPTETEIQFLTLAFNKFYDTFEKIMQDDFWALNAKTVIQL